MSGAPRRRPEIEELVAAYRAELLAAGMCAGHPVTSVARGFLTHVGVAGWAALPLSAQCALPLGERRFVGWLMVTGRLRPSADYLVAGRPYLGEIAAHHHRGFHDRFRAVAATLGFCHRVARLQWSATVKVATLAGLTPDRLTRDAFDRGRVELTAAAQRHNPRGRQALSTAVFGAEATLFHAGVMDTPPRRRHPDMAAQRAAAWASMPPASR